MPLENASLQTFLTQTSRTRYACSWYADRDLLGHCVDNLTRHGLRPIIELCMSQSVPGMLTYVGAGHALCARVNAMDMRVLPKRTTAHDGAAQPRGANTQPPSLVSRDTLYKACALHWHATACIDNTRSGHPCLHGLTKACPCLVRSRARLDSSHWMQATSLLLAEGLCYAPWAT